MTAGSFAKARTTDLIVQEMGEETLVFDRLTDVAHCLTPAATIVWQMCDGETSREDMVAAVSRVAPSNAAETVEAALADLSEKDLLLTGVSRRAALGKMAKYGVGAVTVPLVLSVTAPVALAGLSNGPGTPCTRNAQGVDPDCKTGACSSPATVTATFCDGCAPIGTTVTNCLGNKNQPPTKSVSCCTGNCIKQDNGNNIGVCSA